MSKHKQSPKSYSQHMKKVKQSADPTPTTESSVRQIGSSPPLAARAAQKGVEPQALIDGLLEEYLQPA